MRYKLRSGSKGSGRGSKSEAEPSLVSESEPHGGAGATPGAASACDDLPVFDFSLGSVPSTSKGAAAMSPLLHGEDSDGGEARSTLPLGSYMAHSHAHVLPPVCAGGSASGPPPNKRQRVVRRRKKSSYQALQCHGFDEEEPSELGITDLPQELLLHIAQYLDPSSLLALFKTSRWFLNILGNCNPFWKGLCSKEELSNFSCLLASPEEEKAEQEQPSKVGWAGEPFHCSPPFHYPHWRRVFLKGLHMRRNIWKSNYEGWRIYANSNVPVVKLTPDLDLNEVKKKMGDFPKLSENDDLKIDWDERHLVVFHFFRGEGESCTIRLWDISEEPRFLYDVQKGLECITDKVSVIQDHVVIVPSWPLEARAVVMTLDINNEMAEVGKFLFDSPERQVAIDLQWEHTQLRVIKNTAMVVCRCPKWRIIVVELPSCNLIYEESLEQISNQFDCQQIRSYKETAMILFAKKHNENANYLVTVDIDGARTKIRSVYECADVADVALFTNPEEIYIMKRNGDVLMYDANKKVETIKIANEETITTVSGLSAAATALPIFAQAQHNHLAAQHSGSPPTLPTVVGAAVNEYQLFVNRKEQICVMQSAAEVPQGRNIKVYTYSEKQLYTINLDLCKYGMSRDESICIYTNGAFLAAADSKRFTMFNVKTGNYLGAIQIPPHLERTKGKEEKDCMFEQTGLGLFIFDEDKLIAVHDYERSFPAVLDIYKFW